MDPFNNIINYRKIDEAIAFLRKYETTALSMNPNGYQLAFSGGKDSQVIYDLAVKAGVKFQSIYNVTTVDPPQLIKFIKKNYPDTIFKKPEITMFNLIRREKSLPLKKYRFCCRHLKERTNKEQRVIITGVRTAESAKRAKQESVQHNCNKGIDIISIKPIFHWTNAEVWNYVRKEIGFYCELYDKGFHRLGCVFCPYGSPKTHNKERVLFPGIEKRYKEAIADIKAAGAYQKLNDADEIFDFWISGKNMRYTIGKRNQLIIDWN